MMVGYDQVEPELAGQVRLGQGPDAAVNGNDEAGARVLERQEEDSRAGNAVNVIITVNDDFFARGNRVPDAAHRVFHVSKDTRVGEAGQITREERTRGYGIDDPTVDHQP